MTAVYLPGRKGKDRYPIQLFVAAGSEEKADIERVERLLAPIRDELGALGRLKVSIAALRKRTR